MKRALASLMLILASPGYTQVFTDGVHYHTLDQAARPPAETVTVTEVFSYLCNHCKTFEPYIQNWLGKIPEGVTFERLPVEFGRATGGLYARAYVTASVLGIADEAHSAMMDAIWTEGRQMRSMEQLAEFYSQFGVEAERFVATAQSFAVDMRMRREQQQAREFGVSGTPSMIVNDKYRISAGGAVSGFDQMLAIVDYLVAREQAALADTAAAEPVAATQPPAAE